MYEQVIFYNFFGAGDIFESREFVKAWIQLVPARKYCYAHGKNPRILLDLPEIEYKEPTIHMDSKRGVWDDLNGNLYVNTWIGRDGKYVLPGIGCTVEKLYQMHNDMLKIYNLGELPGSPTDYIPDIDYPKYEILEAGDYLLCTRNMDKIYIDNGLVQSKQAENFDFNPIIERLSKSYSDKLFIVTQPVTFKAENVDTVAEIIQKNVGFDLNEASYISTACRVLIGRNSGPHVYTQVKRNVMSPDKKLLSFTYQQQGSSFVVNTDVPIQKIWSSAIDFNGVLGKIEEVLG